MTDKSGNRENNDPYFDHFPAEEQDRIKKLWEMSAQAAPKEPQITNDEVENALSEVHKHIEEKGGEQQYFEWKWIAAAAVVLLVVGAGILFTPQTTTAPYGELTSVELPDGSSAELNSGSQIQYNRLFTISNRTVHLEGEAFFSVESNDRPFIVNTNNSTIRVTGTKFNVRSWSQDPGGETEVAVSEGSVQFYLANNPDSAVTVSPGELSKLTATMGKPTSPKSVALNRIIGWRNGMLIFDNKSLQIIFKELERRFNVEIRLEGKSLSQETLTIYYDKPKNIESILTDICRVKGLSFSKTANGYRVYK